MYCLPSQFWKPSDISEKRTFMYLCSKLSFAKLSTFWFKSEMTWANLAINKIQPKISSRSWIVFQFLVFRFLIKVIGISTYINSCVGSKLNLHMHLKNKTYTMELRLDIYQFVSVPFSLLIPLKLLWFFGESKKSSTGSPSLFGTVRRPRLLESGSICHTFW